jgi:hypothetical protein
MLKKYRDGFVTMSRLIDGVKFYLTSSPGVVKSLYFPESILRSLKCMSMLVLNKVETKTAFFGTCLNLKQFIIFLQFLACLYIYILGSREYTL